jgi:DNA-binding XRE family transcriptional regulator
MTPLTPEQVRAARQLLDWTTSKLAIRVCVSERTIVAFEAGDPWAPQRSPPLPTASRLPTFLQISDGAPSLLEGA